MDNATFLLLIFLIGIPLLNYLMVKYVNSSIKVNDPKCPPHNYIEQEKLKWQKEPVKMCKCGAIEPPKKEFGYTGKTNDKTETKIIKLPEVAYLGDIKLHKEKDGSNEYLVSDDLDEILEEVTYGKMKMKLYRAKINGLDCYISEDLSSMIEEKKNIIHSCKNSAHLKLVSETYKSINKSKEEK